jgi:hypothetical protein
VLIQTVRIKHSGDGAFVMESGIFTRVAGVDQDGVEEHRTPKHDADTEETPSAQRRASTTGSGCPRFAL